jgi:SHS2 domain-containing protein
MPVNDFPPGIRPLDHTADIGMDVVADSLPQLFRRAAEGLMVFTAAGSTSAVAAPEKPETRMIQLTDEDTALLLAAWLRELLFLMETRRLCYQHADFDHLDEHTLRSQVRFQRCPDRVREIKGVTYHELDVRRDAAQWHARVIFDV